MGVNPVDFRNAVANEVEQPKPIVSPISVMDMAGFASSSNFALSMRRLVWYRSGGIPKERLKARQK